MLALEGPQELIHLQPSCHWCSSPSKQKKKFNNLITYHLCCNQSVPAGEQRTGHDLLCNIIRSSSRNNGYYLKIKMKLGTQKQSRTNMTCKMSSNRSDLTLWAAHYSGHAALQRQIQDIHRSCVEALTELKDTSACFETDTDRFQTLSCSAWAIACLLLPGHLAALNSLFL